MKFKKVLILCLTHILWICLFASVTYVIFLILPDFMPANHFSDSKPYFDAIFKMTINLLIYHFLCSLFAKYYFQDIINFNLLCEEEIVNNIFYHLFFSLTAIAFSFLFGIKDITLELAFPKDLSTRWLYNTIFYWCTGYISIIFLYFKQLREMRENYINKKSNKTY